MTIDIPVDSPKGNILNDLTNSFIGTNKKENPSNPETSDTNRIPLVVLKKCEDNKYYVVSPRSSTRRRTIKKFQDFEMNLSATNLKSIGNGSVSPRKRERSKKVDCDQGTSPMKLQKTQKILHKNVDSEDNVDNLCTSLKNSVKLTPVKRSLYKTDFCDVELMEDSPSPRKKGAQERTPIKNTPKRGRGRLAKSHNSSPMKTDGIEDSSSSPIRRSVNVNLDESFRRSVLKSTLTLENVANNSSAQQRRTTRGSIAKQSTPTKSCLGARTPRQSYASFYYSDSDDIEEQELKKQSDMVVLAKRRILRSRSNSSTSSNLDDLPLKNRSLSDDEYIPAENNKTTLSSSSESNNELEVDSEPHEIVLPKTPSRRKQVLKPRKDSTTLNSSEKSKASPERGLRRKVTKTLTRERDRKHSVASNAVDKSPERRSPRKAAKTPKTPRNTKRAPATPKSVKVTPKTPKNRLKLLRDGIITPSMHSRSSTILGDSTPLMKARSQLHVSHVPTSLPCREKEYLDVYNFLRGKLDDGYGGCMYISGVPGTGKTATVTSVIDNLQKDKKVPQFCYVSVNGMRLTEPRQSYVEIWKQLTSKTIPWEQAQSLLEERFTKKKNLSPVVMLIDELDILCTKRQDVVYNLLDWPAKSKDQLIVITIANTMDLPERLLMSRVTSRLGLTRLTFQAYTHKQLMEIVTKRLTGTNSFNPDAIQLVARKVASVSGDARRALDICRRAAEIADDEGKGQLVNIMHINEALNAMITQPQVMAIKRCSRLQKLLLQAIVAEIERTGVEETTFSDVFRILVSCCALDGFRMVTGTVAQRAICELSAYRLVITDQKCSNIYQRIILNVSVHDVYFALKKD